MVEFLLMIGGRSCGVPGGPFGRSGGKLARCNFSCSSKTADFGEQQIVFFFLHLNISVVSALPKQVKDKYGTIQVPGHSGRSSGTSVVVVVVCVVVVVGGCVGGGG